MKNRIKIKQYQKYEELRNGGLERILANGNTAERQLWETISENLRFGILIDIKLQLRDGLERKQLKFGLSEAEVNTFLSFRADEILADSELIILFNTISRLEKLNLRNRNIESLTLSPYLTSLKELSISDNNWKDFQSLESLGNRLEILYCINCKVSSLEFLKSFTKLKQLYCGLNKLNSLDEIGAIKKLSLLNCRGNSIPKFKIRDFQAENKDCKVYWKKIFLF